MQYALINVSDQKVIIDANEVAILENYKKGAGISDYEPAEENLSLKLVYGSVIPQPDSEYEELKKMIQESIGHALGCIFNEKCHLLELQDIILYEQQNESLHSVRSSNLN